MEYERFQEILQEAVERAMELIDIRDEEGRPTGRIKDREEIHRDGDLHATSHVWIVDNQKDSCRILLQKRSMDKDA